MSSVFHLAGICLLAMACETHKTVTPIVYDGPLKQATNIEMHYAEAERLKTVMRAKKFNEFLNGDREFPEGIYLEFYNAAGVMTSTLRANQAFYFRKENKWRGRGKVEVVNIEKEQQLNTEELFWFPTTHKIHSDKFVTVRDHQDIIYGTGMDAFQDLSTYSLRNTSAEMHVND